MGVQTTACLDLQLQTLGKVKGDSTTISLGRKGLIEVLAYHHDVVVNRDPQPGTATGQRVEKPVRWSTPVGTASVALFQGLVANDTIVKAVFRFFNHDRAGKEREYSESPSRTAESTACRRGCRTRRPPIPPTRTNTTSLNFPTARSRSKTSLSVSRPLTTGRFPRAEERRTGTSNPGIVG